MEAQIIKGTTRKIEFAMQASMLLRSLNENMLQNLNSDRCTKDPTLVLELLVDKTRFLNIPQIAVKCMLNVDSKDTRTMSNMYSQR